MRNWFSRFAGWEGAQDNRESQAAKTPGTFYLIVMASMLSQVLTQAGKLRQRGRPWFNVLTLTLTLTLNLGGKMPSEPWREEGHWGWREWRVKDQSAECEGFKKLSRNKQKLRN